MSTANDLTQAVKNLFLDSNRDLLALTKDGPNGVFRRIAAALALDADAQSDCLMYVDTLDQPHKFAREMAQDDFRNAMLVAICKAYLKIQRNGVVQYVSKLTEEAAEQLETIEIIAGERASRAVEPPPAPVKSAQEQLEDQVRDDWKRLETKKMRLKMNNPAYKAVVDKLMADGSLESQITTLTDHSGALRR